MLTGQTRVLTQIPIPAGDVRTIRSTEAHFISDTVVLLRNDSGLDAVDLRTGATRKLYSGKMRPRNTHGVSPDGNWAAFTVWKENNSVPMLWQ